MENQLANLQPSVFGGSTVVIDEADRERTVYLAKENGTGSNPGGTSRGYLSDPGDTNRLPNISGGKYTWWNNLPGKDVMFYRPGVEGAFRLFLSWGAHGSGVHTRDARYLLDLDGNPETRSDQREIASIDQYYPAHVSTGETEKRPLWSGFLYAGTLELRRESILLLRGGSSGTGITADVIVLQSDNTANPPVKTGVGEKNAPVPRLRPAVQFAENHEKFAPIQARYVRWRSLATDSNNLREPCLDELEIYTSGKDPVNVALRDRGGVATSSGNFGDGSGIHQLKHVNDGRPGNSYSWISNQAGKGWVQIELANEHEIDRIVWGRDRLGKFRDRLAIEYEIEVSRDGENWIQVASHRDRVPFGTPGENFHFMQRLVSGKDRELVARLGNELVQLKKKKQQLEKPALVYAGKFRSPDPSFVLRRGNPELKGAPVGPAIPSLFTGTLAVGQGNDLKAIDEQLAAGAAPVKGGDAPQWTPEQQRRLALAKWITSPDHPLTARVMVNRVWMHHFGRGLVETPSDFGVNAPRPTHPELLDWLAGEFVRNRWSIKYLHELIVSSETWKQQSKVRQQARQTDADNRYYWRFATRRLEAEAIRDSMLAVSGELNLEMGGPGFDFFKTRGGLSGFPAVTEFGPQQMRRMIYAHKIRMERVPVFGAFDCPDAGQAMPSRSRSTTAIQALNLFNSPFVNERASRFADRISRVTGSGNLAAQVESCFRAALGRRPNSVELEASVEVARDHGLTAVCRALFNSSEFLFLP